MQLTFQEPSLSNFWTKSTFPHNEIRMIILFGFSEPSSNAQLLLLEPNRPHNLFLIAFMPFLFLMHTSNWPVVWWNTRQFIAFIYFPMTEYLCRIYASVYSAHSSYINASVNDVLIHQAYLNICTWNLNLLFQSKMSHSQERQHSRGSCFWLLILYFSGCVIFKWRPSGNSNMNT